MEEPRYCALIAPSLCARRRPGEAPERRRGHSLADLNFTAHVADVPRLLVEPNLHTTIETKAGSHHETLGYTLPKAGSHGHSQPTQTSGVSYSQVASAGVNKRQCRTDAHASMAP